MQGLQVEAIGQMLGSTDVITQETLQGQKAHSETYISRVDLDHGWKPNIVNHSLKSHQQTQQTNR